MGVDLPKTSTAFLGLAAAHAVRRPTDVRGAWTLGLLAAVVVYAPGLLLGAGSAPWARIPWLLAPMLAVAAWVTAARRADAGGRVASRAFAAAALCALLAQVVFLLDAWGLASLDVPLAAYVSLLGSVLLSLALFLALGSRRGALTWGLTADALLIGLAGAAAVLRLVAEPLLASGGLRRADLGPMALQQLVGLVPIFVASLVVLRRRGSVLAPGSAAALLAATIALAAGGMLSLPGLQPQGPGWGGGFHDAWLLGWLLVALAGFTARPLPPTAPDVPHDRPRYHRFRRTLVPMAALVLAAGVVDLGLRPGAWPGTVVALALLGVTLALRTAHAASVREREKDSKRQLAHTQALLEVTHWLAAAPDLDTTLAVILNSARTVLRAGGAGIELITEDGTLLETRAAAGLPADVVGLRFPLDGSFTGWVVEHGEARATVDASTDPHIHPEGLRFLGRSPMAAAPIRFRGETTGALYACSRSEPFDAEELAFLRSMAEQAAIAIERARLFHQVSVLSVTDPLTGLANRRSLERELEREFAAARRGRELSAVMFDLDAFKQYNDAFGHLAGDEALQAFARAVREETRAMNLVARYGGDEFVALLSGTSPEGARAFIQRVRERFGEEATRLGRGPIGVSAGLAAFDPAMRGPDDLLRAADEELYRQKPRTRV